MSIPIPNDNVLRCLVTGQPVSHEPLPPGGTTDCAPCSWAANVVEVIINGVRPVRVCEGGGPEDLMMSLAVTIAGERMKYRPFDERGANRLADEVAVLVRRRVIDARSPAGDALLDYRDPPTTPRADRLAALEARLADILAIPCAHCGGGLGERPGEIDPDSPHNRIYRLLHGNPG